MMFEWLTMMDQVPTLLAAAEGGVGHAAEVADAGYGSAEDELPEAGQMAGLLYVAVIGGVFVLSLGMAMCLYRLVRGPALADRVLAADLLALHVVGLVILLTIYLGRMVFFDAALAVSILGFVSTLGFAQYIYAQARAAQADDDPDRETLRERIEKPAKHHPPIGGPDAAHTGGGA